MGDALGNGKGASGTPDPIEYSYINPTQYDFVEKALQHIGCLMRFPLSDRSRQTTGQQPPLLG